MNFYWEIILHGMFNALWIVAVWNLFLPGQLLGPIGDFLAGNSKVVPVIEPHAPDYVTKPLFECPRCQASLHGVLWWVMFQHVPWYLLPVYVVCLSGLMTIVTITVLSKDHD